MNLTDISSINKYNKFLYHRKNNNNWQGLKTENNLGAVRLYGSAKNPTKFMWLPATKNALKRMLLENKNKNISCLSLNSISAR